MTEQNISEKTTFTETEIVEMFQNDETLNKEFKSEVLTLINSWCQAMYNCVHERDTTMIVLNPHGDTWVSDYNRFAELYQKYHS